MWGCTPSDVPGDSLHAAPVARDLAARDLAARGLAARDLAARDLAARDLAERNRVLCISQADRASLLYQPG